MLTFHSPDLTFKKIGPGHHNTQQSAGLDVPAATSSQNEAAGNLEGIIQNIGHTWQPCEKIFI